jgi:hypothetical protein
MNYTITAAGAQERTGGNMPTPLTYLNEDRVRNGEAGWIEG